jgi:hypothetical protein
MLRRITLVAVIMAVTVPLFVAARQKASDGAESEKAAREEREKKLNKVDLSISTVGEDYETPRAQYRVGEPVVVRVNATNRDDKLAVISTRKGYEHFFPLLMKDGLPVPYSQQAKGRLANTDEPIISGSWAVRIEPQAEKRLALSHLSRWYGQLEPGVYQLTMRFGLDRKDRKVKSNTVVFEVVAQ